LNAKTSQKGQLCPFSVIPPSPVINTRGPAQGKTQHHLICSPHQKTYHMTDHWSYTCTSTFVEHLQSII